MFVPNMTLKQMIDFKPNDEDMAMLPLDVVTWLRISIVSLYKEDNYTFIYHLFEDELVKDYLKDINKTVIYDFDGHNTRQERFVSVFENYGLVNSDRMIAYLKERMEDYGHEADVLIDIYTHDNHSYRLSNLDGIVKSEEMKN